MSAKNVRFFGQLPSWYRPFHITLPRSRVFVNWISVRFYETDCSIADTIITEKILQHRLTILKEISSMITVEILKIIKNRKEN